MRVCLAVTEHLTTVLRFLMCLLLAVGFSDKLKKLSLENNPKGVGLTLGSLQRFIAKITESKLSCLVAYLIKHPLFYTSDISSVT